MSAAKSSGAERLHRSLHRVRALVVKELLAVLRDRKSRMVLILPPLLQLTIFAFAATLEVKNIALAVLDKDGGKAAVELVQRFSGSPSFSRVYPLASQGEVATALEDEKAMAVLVLGQDFSRDVAAGRPAEAQLLLDGRRSNSAQIVQGYAQSIVEQYNRDLAERYGQPGPPATLVARNWFNPNLDYLWFTVPNLIGMLTMVVGLIVTALSVARERELGTFDQLLVSPLSPREILAGKTIPAMILGAVESVLIVVAAIVAFRIPCVGSLFVLALAMLLFLFSVVGFGLFISSLCNTQQQAILGTFTFMMPATLLSGFATPIETMPMFLQVVSLANPLRHFLVAVRAIMLKGMPAFMVLDTLWPLVVIGAVTLALAGWLFRRGIG
ncbi:ABC-2 type transport system permease protein [Humidesulfovibrio mexicanus]|uniref:ABC-2 type transport system permease protein n=1 Tax=Humidesulfovibrio mexicanus TaxID=147047 RepID=A0A238YX76_9BACT|nr:ABC transporter permease [Humidesulfovibrio mexicanus]SNR75562.1 ABC-2 type transport system permease protein [Humidesulfovibrio mexicanus]